MKSKPADSRLIREYSPVGALCLLFATMFVLQGSSLLEDFKQHSKIQTARAQLKPALAHALNVSQTAEAASRELIVLSGSSAEAANIVAEFKITMNNPGMSGP